MSPGLWVQSAAAADFQARAGAQQQGLTETTCCTCSGCRGQLSNDIVPVGRSVGVLRRWRWRRRHGNTVNDFVVRLVNNSATHYATQPPPR